MRVLVVTIVHTPLDARIYHRQIRALITAGHHVTFVAPVTGFGINPETFTATKRLTVVDVTRAAGRKRLRALRHARRLIAHHAPGHDVILIHDPELLFVATRRTVANTPVVYDVHEHAAAALTERTYLPVAARKLAGRLVDRAERRAEKRHSIILAEPGYQARFSNRHAVVENLPWAAMHPPPAASTNQVVYLGRIAALRGAHELVSLAKRLNEAGGPTLHLIGPVDRDVADVIATAVNDGHLVSHGPLANDVALRQIAGAYAGLSLLHDTENYRVSRPTKLLEYFAWRIPIITTPLPQAVKLVERAQSGTVVAYGAEGVDAAFDTIMRYVNEPASAVNDGDTGYKWVTAHGTFDRQADTFVNVLKKAVR